MFKLFSQPVVTAIKGTYIISNKYLLKKCYNSNSLLKRGFKFQSNKGIKVVLLGANGHIGQNIALLLKQCSVIDELTLYDVASTAGLCMEMNHIDTKCKVTHYDGRNCLREALHSARIVVMVAGLPRNEGMTRDDLFNSNAMIASGLAQACAESCPSALLAVVTNPINSIVPVVCEVYKKICHMDCSKNIFGVTTLDSVRANTFVGEVLSAKPETIVVPVVGGHSASTIVPLLSQTKPSAEFSTAEVVRITKAIQEAGDEVVKAKKKGSATLSTAFAVAKFVTSLANALTGQRSIVECAYVASNVIANVPYLATELEFGPQGLQKNLGLPRVMSDYECCLLETCIPILQKDIAKGKEFVEKRTQGCEEE